MSLQCEYLPGVLQHGGPELILLPNYSIKFKCSKIDIKPTQITPAKYLICLMGTEAREHTQEYLIQPGGFIILTASSCFRERS